MQDLKCLSVPELIDMLAEQTSTYMKILNKGATKEQLQNCREAMTEIQLEIETRKSKKQAPDSHSDAERVNGGKNLH